MAVKSAIGKGVTLSQPALGTIKRSAPDTSTVGVSTTKKSKKSEGGIDRKESAPPAEIVSVADFNRVFDSAGYHRVERTPYGQYYNALDSVHSITTEDVSYVISKSLENDSAGSWNARKTAVDSDVSDASDLVSDLAAFLNALERTELALDIGRSSDDQTQSFAEDFLDSKLKSVETPASERKFTAKDVLGSLFEDDSNADCLRKMLSSLRETLTLENESTYKDFIDYASQIKRRVDLNPDTAMSETMLWYRTQSLASDVSERMVACVEILSQIMSISSGIPRVQSDTISSKISLNTSDPGAVFNGTSAWARLNKTTKADALPFRKSLAAAGPSSILPALYMLQADGDDMPIIPVELEDSSTGAKYKSGINALIRDPLLAGDFDFTRLTSFVKAFEESRQNIETYTELILGRLDPSNKLTPLEILRIIIKNFADGLKLAISDDSARFQLFLLNSARKSSQTSSFMGSALQVSGIDHSALRIAGKIKHYQLKNSTSTTSNNEEAVSNTSLSTTKVSSNSESLKDDAAATTTQVESKSGVQAERTIRRSASSSPSGEDLAASIFEKLASISDDGPGNADSIKESLAEEILLMTVYNLLQGLTDDALNDKLFDAITKQFPTVTFETGKSQGYYITKYIETVANIKELEDSLRQPTTKYTSGETIKTYFQECQSATDGTFMSTIVSAYNDIVAAALDRVPAGEKIVNSDGFTRFAGLDEFALMSLIIECYIILASQIKMSSTVDSYTSPTGMNLGSVTSTMISRYADHLNAIISDSDDSALLNTTAPGKSSATAWSAARICLNRQKRYQNIHAFLSAYSNVLSNSKDSLISSIKDLLTGDNRQAVLNTPQGREMLSNLTTQQIVYRRSLLDKCGPDPEYGYLPSRVRYSKTESDALNALLSSPDFSSRSSENIRIMFVGVPIGLINNSKRYIDENVGDVNRTGMLELIAHRKDHELDDLIFKEKVYLFDPQLYLSPGSFDDFLSMRKDGEHDITLSIAKRSTFTLYDRDSKETLQYSNLASHPRYAQLTKNQIDQIVKNAVAGFLLETYIYKTTGAIFDETLSLKIDDSTSEAGRAALITTAGLNLPDLVLPTADQINAIFGNDGEVDFINSDSTLSTGDKELIASLTSSYLMRNDTLVNRVLAPSKFDRVLAIAIDPDNFEIDKTESVNRNGEIASNMLQSLVKQGLLIDEEGTLTIAPRDPLTGGFSIGSISCQFSPHTASSESGTLLRITKEFSIAKATVSSKSTKLSKAAGLKNNSSSSKSIKKASSGSFTKTSSNKLKR